MRELEEVYGFWHTSFWATWPGIGVILAGLSISCIGCGLLAWYLWRTLTKKNEWQIAYATCSNLASMQIIDFKAQQKFYTNASQILKILITQHETTLRKKTVFGITENELITYIEASQARSHAFTDLLRFFQHAVRVKFNQEILAKKTVLADQRMLCVLLEQLKPKGS